MAYLCAIIPGPLNCASTAPPPRTSLEMSNGTIAPTVLVICSLSLPSEDHKTHGCQNCAPTKLSICNSARPAYSDDTSQPSVDEGLELVGVTFHLLLIYSNTYEHEHRTDSN